MVLEQISSSLYKRRNELVNMLNTNDDLDLEKQHQLYGAINEIDLFLHTLNYYEKNKPKKDEEVFLVKPPKTEKGIFNRMFETVKGKVQKNK